MKRKLKWLSFVLAILLLGFGTALLLWPQRRITEETWKTIRLGMTEKEVVAILGEAGLTFSEFRSLNAPLEDEDAKGRFKVSQEPERFTWDEEREYRRFWGESRRCMELFFDKEGQVRAKRYWDAGYADPTLIERLRHWLGW
jgi:hypothetical protein